MKVAAYDLGSIGEPRTYVQHGQLLAMTLRPGSLEVGLRPSEMIRSTYGAGAMILPRRHTEEWVQADHMGLLVLEISDTALVAAHDGRNAEVELCYKPTLMDVRVGALVAAVNAERIAGFPSGRLFLDSVEQALAAALVESHATHPRPVPIHRGGLSPARLRRVTELLHARIEDELSLEQMAESAGLSTAHFSQMFRESTGESPHRFLLRLRVERAKEMLRRAETRVLDVAVACGFKTQQHFARVFRQLCGTSPTEYRQEFLR
jgi:AraC family transcriptional regulator